MLFVLGAGFYTPESKLSDQFLLDLGLSNQSAGLVVKDRRSTLPLSLLAEEKNRDLVRSMRDATISCSEMGERAALQALERAQIRVDQIGLVIADCVTPIETTPAESQRVAGRLGLKVPAYDIYSTNGICPAHFSILSKWKKERVPNYVLCVSTNAPTQRIDYSKGAEGWIFADGAAACVVSLNEGPGLEVLWSDYQVDVSQHGAHSLDTLGFLTCQQISSNVLRTQFQTVIKSIEAAQQIWGNKKLDVIFAASEDVAVLKEMAGASTISDRFENSIEEYGNMFGTNSFADIGAQWDSFSNGQLIGVVVAQGLPGFGSAVFRVRKYRVGDAMMHILGMGFARPETVFDNQFLEGLEIGTTAEWIYEKIGIHTRKSTLPIDYVRNERNQDLRRGREVATESPTDLAVRAALVALRRAGITAKDVGVLICNCCAPDFLSPTEGQRIAQRLGVPGVSYDVFSACPAFALHMDYVANFEPDNLPAYVLCISTAALTQRVNYNDRTDGAIWGDGAAAWVVSTQKKGKLKVLHTHFMADPTRCGAVVVETLGHFRQDGRAVRDFSVRQTVRLIKAMEETFNLDWKKDIFVGHQANRTMLQQITKNRQIPEENHWHNVETSGNQAGASAAIVLAEHWDNFVSGRRIAIAVVGAGLSWGSVLLEIQ